MSVLTERDVEHLRLLSLFHYIFGAIQALFSLFPLLHLGMGLLIVFSPETFCSSASASKCPPGWFGWIFIGLAIIIMVMGLLYAVGMILTGRFLARRQAWLACIIIAALECMIMPFGTVLGIFTIYILSKANVKAAFEAGKIAELDSKAG